MGKYSKKKPSNLIRNSLLFLCVGCVFLIIFWCFELFSGLIFKIEEEPVVPDPPISNALIEGLDVNEYQMEAFGELDGFITYDGRESVRTGVDVSAHQGVIDWNAVSMDGIDFAFIRVAYRGYTEGDIIMDEYFHQNIEGAIANGLDVGVYFFSQAINEEEAIEEAGVVLDAIAGYDITYPVVYDWEEIAGKEARTTPVDNATLNLCVNAFFQTIEDAGYDTTLYFNQTFGYQRFDLVNLQEHTFWLAQYDKKPSFLYDFEIWQYTDAGSVNGITTPVDLNLHFS